MSLPDQDESFTRFLATLRMPSDNVNVTEDATTFHASRTAVVAAMHHTPRFGYSHHIGLIASPNPMEYASGVKQFTLFYLIVPFVLWACLLLSFKLCYGLSKVGCAAGGQVLDMYHLSKELGLTRKQRKKRILRSWKLQGVFMVTSLGIPIVSIVMMTVGLPALTLSIVELQGWVNDVETLAYRGWDALNGLQNTQHELFSQDNNTVASNNLFVQGIFEYHQQQVSHQQELEHFAQHHPDVNIDGQVIYPSSPVSVASNSFVETWCPGAANATTELDAFFNAMDTIQGHAQGMLELIEQFGASSSTQQSISSSFRVVTQTTLTVDSTLEWVLQNDWILKMLIMALNVVSFGLFLNVFLLSKNNVIHPPTRFYVAWVMMPLFVLLLLAIFIVTMLLGISSISNADFCSGGIDGTMQGTLEDALLAYFNGGDLRTRINTTGMSISTMEQARHTPPVSMAYAAIDYYASGCLSDNPMEFLDVVTAQLDAVAAQVNQLTSVLVTLDNGNDSNHTSLLHSSCGNDVSFLFPSLQDLNDKIGLLSSNLHKLTDDVIGCNQISPLYKRLTHGAICHESPYGLTVMWVCALTLGILGFIMLTTRAALYNSVKRKKPREKKPRRVVEKEFDSYKEFMKDYYGNTDGWTLDEPLPSEYGEAVAAIKATKIALEFDNGLETIPTFETATSSDGSSPNSGSGLRQLSPRQRKRGSASKISGIHIRDNVSVEVSHLWNTEDDSSCGSSYESECSDDSMGDDVGSSLSDHDDDESAILSFFSETRSMAMHTIHSLQRLKPLLASVVPPGLLPSPTEEVFDENDDDDFLFQDKDIGVDGKKNRLEHCVDFEPSICDESLYLGDSICEPPRTPGLQPTSLLVFGNRDSKDDGDSDNNFGYANHYISSRNASKNNGMLMQRGKSFSWFGRSARHPNNKTSSIKERSPPRVLKVITPSSIMSALTPTAPYKPFSFLTRAKKEETDGLLNGTDQDKEGAVEDREKCLLVTPGVRHRRHPSAGHSPSAFSLLPGEESPLPPTKLEMSPLLVHRHKKRSKSSEEDKPVTHSYASRMLDFQTAHLERNSKLASNVKSSRTSKVRQVSQARLPITTPSKTTIFTTSVHELVSRYNSSNPTVDEPSKTLSMASDKTIGSSARVKSSSAWTRHSNK